MRRNWMDDLAKGVDTGYKLGQMYRENKMQGELKGANKIGQEQVTEYTPEQIRQIKGDTDAQDGEIWSEADQAYKNADGGLRMPVNVPTAQDGGYNMPDGTQFNPRTQYRLGIQQQDNAFTADDIAQEKLNRKADIYSNYGKEDMAETMRNNASSRGLQAQQLKLSQSQLEDANIKLGYAKNESALFKIRHDLSTGKISEDEAMAQLVDATDPMHKDGITHGFKKLGDGTYEVTQMKNNNIVGSQQGVTFDAAFSEALKYANPQNLKDAEDQAYKEKRDAVTDANNDRNFGLNLSVAESEAAHRINSDKEETRKNDAYIQNLKDRLGLDEKELVLKGLVSRAQAAAYHASAGKDSSISNAYKNIVYSEDGTAMEVYQGKTGGMQVRPILDDSGKPFRGSTKGTGIKDPRGMSISDLDAAEEVLRKRYPTFESMPISKQEELRNSLLGGTTAQPNQDIMAVVAGDNGDIKEPRGFRPQVVTGKIRPAN